MLLFNSLPESNQNMSEDGDANPPSDDLDITPTKAIFDVEDTCDNQLALSQKKVNILIFLKQDVNLIIDHKFLRHFVPLGKEGEIILSGGKSIGVEEFHEG